MRDRKLGEFGSFRLNISVITSQYSSGVSILKYFIVLKQMKKTGTFTNL
jgi:hypothetical protein